MKLLHIFSSLGMAVAICFLFSNSMAAQDLGEIDGTLGIRLNSTSGIPHLRLTEDDISIGGSTRISMTHQDNPTDEFELRAFLSASLTSKRVGWYYNNSSKMVYSTGTHEGLGIGETHPDQRLHVKFSGGNGMFLEGNGTGDARIWFANGGGSSYIFDDNSDANAFSIASANDLKIEVNGTERMRFIGDGSFNDGNLGINDQPKLGRQVYINTDDQLYGFEVENENPTTAVGVGGEVVSTGSSNKFGTRGEVTGSSGTGLALYGIQGVASTTPANSYAVYCSGDFHITGTMTGPSDIKLKDNIENLQPVLNKVLQMEAKTYTYKQEEFPGLNLANGTQKGFIAQDLQQLFPEVVEIGQHVQSIDDSEGVEILSVKYLELIPILTKAIQEQQVIMDQMQQEIDVLKARK